MSALRRYMNVTEPSVRTGGCTPLSLEFRIWVRKCSATSRLWGRKTDGCLVQMPVHALICLGNALMESHRPRDMKVDQAHAVLVVNAMQGGFAQAPRRGDGVGWQLNLITDLVGAAIDTIQKIQGLMVGSDKSGCANC